MGEVNDSVREVVDNIITHPLFRQTLSDILNQSPVTTAASDPALLSNQLPRPTSVNSSVQSTLVHQSNSSINSNRSLNSINSSASRSSRYTTPNEEFSALFRQGSSRGRAPVFQRGISHRHSARARRRATSVPYAKAPKNNDQHRRRDEIFISKEIILLPDSKADRVVRAPEKADLMEHGFVLNETRIDKNWSDKEVFQHFDQCFEEKLSSEEFSSVNVGATSISTRFEILLGVGTSLRKPCLTKDQVLDGALISRLFSQKIIWLRPFNDLPTFSQQMTLDRFIEDDAQTQIDDNSDEDQKRYSEAVNQLAELYPDKKHSQLLSALMVCKGCVDEAAQLLLDADESEGRHAQSSISSFTIDIDEIDAKSYPSTFPCSSTHDEGGRSCILPPPALPSPLSSDQNQNESPHIILQNFSASAIDSNDDLWLNVKREDLWCICLAFYKLALKHPDRLKKNLCIKFTGSGEFGIDAGALRNEFFSLCFEEVVKRLFEGDGALIPRRGIGSKSIQFEVVGELIAHSVLQGGPGFPLLAKWVVNYILGDEPSNLPISKSFISLSEMTSTLLELIDNLDEAKTPEKLHYILETHPKSASFWEVINSSEWSCTEVINLENKGCLVHELIYNELVRRRKDQLDSLCKGLESLGFLGLLKMHHRIAFHVLSYHVLELTAEIFTSFLQSHPTTNAEKQAYQWLLNYIESSYGVNLDDFPRGKLNTLLKFSTSLWNIPPMQSKTSIQVKFLDDDEVETLPKAGVCTNILYIPTVHSSEQAFVKNMDVALKHGHSGFTEY